jgi:predicted 2-oxoglutarate/Fe(II)-dependent dioxygenase YbiX
VTDFAAAAIPLLIAPQFLTPRDCERVRRAMDRGDEDPAEIVGDMIVTREAIRRTISIEIEPDVREWFERRLADFRPAIAQALGRPLGQREGTGFLRYPPGGYYLAHRDRGEVAGWPAAARRAASVVVFLNGSTTNSPRSSQNGEFEGGLLCLHPDSTGTPVEITPEAGLLVAFPAEVLHEVLPVRRGTRDAAVDWFYDA